MAAGPANAAGAKPDFCPEPGRMTVEVLDAVCRPCTEAVISPCEAQSSRYVCVKRRFHFYCFYRQVIFKPIISQERVRHAFDYPNNRQA